MNITNTKLFLSVAAGILFSAAYAYGQEAPDTRDVVRDVRNNVVKTTSGSCVRTRWDIGSDPCAMQVKAETPHIKRARELAKEERTVYFEFNSAEITSPEQQKLNSLAKVLRSDAEVRDVLIVGYADRIGSASYNKRLSERRAKNVERYLHEHDYLNTKLAKVRWLGKAGSVTHCPSTLKRKALIACLRKDRRVEVEIEYYPPNATGQ